MSGGAPRGGSTWHRGSVGQHGTAWPMGWQGVPLGEGQHGTGDL